MELVDEGIGSRVGGDAAFLEDRGYKQNHTPSVCLSIYLSIYIYLYIYISIYISIYIYIHTPF